MALEARANQGAEGASEATSCASWAPVADATSDGAREGESGLPAWIRPRVRRLDPLTYVRSADFFDAVRDAAEERAGILRAIGAMESREGVRAQGYEATGRSGHASDRMAATDARMDYEADRGPVLEEDEAMLRLAESLIWGGDGGDMRGGVLSLMGYEVAYAMENYYVHALPWAEVARRLGYSADYTEKPKALCRQGLDCIDFLGWASVIPGGGKAT